MHAVQEAWLRELLLAELAPSKLKDIFAKDGLFFVGEFVVAVTATACRPELGNGACERKVQLQRQRVAVTQSATYMFLRSGTV